MNRRFLLALLALTLAVVPAARAHDDLDEALARVERALAGAPGSARLHLERGELLRVGGDPAGALAEYDRAEALAPGLPEVDRCRGAALLDAGRDREAARVLERYLARVPDDARALAMHARAHARLSEPAEEVAAPPRSAAARDSIPTAPALTRGPYLQRATTHSVVVRWRTDVATDGRVWVGPAPDSLARAIVDTTLTTEHVVLVDSLPPGARVFYAVGAADTVLAGGDSTCVVATLPPDAAPRPLRLWATGDSGLPGPGQRGVRDAFERWAGGREPDAWLLLGDNAYELGTDAQYQAGLFDAYPGQLRRTVLWPTRGNHDILYAGAGNDYYDLFTLPTAGESGGRPSGTESWYAFDWANVHVVCLDSEGSDRSPGGPMLTWLANDLATRRGEWAIAFWHHPPYTKGSHDSDDPADSGGRMRQMRENVLPLLEAAGVDLVLTGHSHSYERSMLLDGHYGLSTTLTAAMLVDSGDGRPDGDGAYAKASRAPAPHTGTVYTVAGSSSRHDGGTLDHPAMVASLDLLGSLVVDIDGPVLAARFLDTLGVARDSFVVVRNGDTSVPGGRGAPALWMITAWPNPARGEVAFTFGLARAARARVDVLDVSGRRIVTLADGALGAGAHVARWRAGDAPAGVYHAVLTSEGRRIARRFVRIR